MSINFKYESIEKIKNGFKKLLLAMNNAARDTGRALSQESEKLAKKRVSSPHQKPGKGAGNYFHTIHSDFKDGTKFFIGSLKSESPIAGVIEFGSRPHIIRPKENNFLFWSGAKHPVREVNHPGTPAFRVLGDAVEDAVQETKEKFKQAIKNQFGP